MGDCPAPSPTAPVPQWGTVTRAQLLVVLGEWGQGPATWLPDSSGCCPVRACGMLCAQSCFLDKKPCSQALLFIHSGWLAGWLILAGWHGCAAGSAGEPRQGWLGRGCFTAVIVTAQSGTGGVDTVPVWAAHPGAAVPGAALQGPLPSPVPSRGCMPGPLCCVSPVDAQSSWSWGQREGKGGWTQTPGFCALKGSSPYAWVATSPGCSWRGRDGTSCRQRGVRVKHLGPASSPTTCPMGQPMGPSAVWGLDVSQAWMQLILRGLGSLSKCAQTHSGTSQVHLALQTRNWAG